MCVCVCVCVCVSVCVSVCLCVYTYIYLYVIACDYASKRCACKIKCQHFHPTSRLRPHEHACTHAACTK